MLGRGDGAGGFVTDDSRGVGVRARGPGGRSWAIGLGGRWGTPCNTLGLERSHADHLSTSPDTSGLFVVRRRVRRRPSAGAPPSVLQPRLSPTRLRTPTRFRTRANRAPAAGTGPRRDLDWYWVRAHPDRPGRFTVQGACPAYLGSPGGSSPRDAVWAARPATCRTTLQRVASVGVHDMRRASPSRTRCDWASVHRTSSLDCERCSPRCANTASIPLTACDGFTPTTRSRRRGPHG